MDIFGVAVIAFVTALGGGTLRDVIFWPFPDRELDPASRIRLSGHFRRPADHAGRTVHDHLQRVFLVLDALGLIAFSLIGCNIALELNYPAIVVIMAGMLTGISGGILRDVLCNLVRSCSGASFTPAFR